MELLDFATTRRTTAPSFMAPCPHFDTPADAEAEGETQNSGSRGLGGYHHGEARSPHGLTLAEAEAEGEAHNSGSGSYGAKSRADRYMEMALPKDFHLGSAISMDQAARPDTP